LKSKDYLLIALLLILSFSSFNINAADADLRNIDFNSKLYDYFDYLKVNSQIDISKSGEEPFTYSELWEITKVLEDEKEKSPAEEYILKYFNRKLSENYFLDDNKLHYTADLSSSYFNRENGNYLNSTLEKDYGILLNNRLSYSPSKNIYGVFGLNLSKSSENDYIDISPAYIKTKYKALTFEVGKSSLKWGPGQFASLSLATDAYNTPYFYGERWFKDLEEIDLFKLTADIKNIQLSYLTAADYFFWSEKENNEPALSALRADWQLNDNIKIGAGDLVISDNSFESGILIQDPLAYFTDITDSPQEDDNVNLMGTADFTITIPEIAEIYGEYIWDSTISSTSIDIYQAESSGAKQGWLGGLYLPFETEKALYAIRAEYSKIDETVYSFPLNNNLEYKYGESWLGHWAGADSKVGILELSTNRFNDLDIALRYIDIEKEYYSKAAEDLEIYILEIAKKIDEKSSLQLYLQSTEGDSTSVEGNPGDSFAVKYQYKF